MYTVHGFDSIRVAYRRYLPVERVLQTRCKSIVGVSKYDGENLQKEGIINNISVIYNGLSTPCKLKRNPFEHLNGYTHKVLCVARLSPQKRWIYFWMSRLVYRNMHLFGLEISMNI